MMYGKMNRRQAISTMAKIAGAAVAGVAVGAAAAYFLRPAPPTETASLTKGGAKHITPSDTLVVWRTVCYTKEAEEFTTKVYKDFEKESGIKVKAKMEK